MGFSFLSWNVEHFKPNPGRLQRVANHIRSQDPDVFGLFEVENLDIQQLMEDEFPAYTFGITDGPENMEILVGWRTAKFSQAIFTQKREFKAFNPSLRPGALLSVRVDNALHNLLFLHTDSGTDAAGFGNRFEMFEHIWKMKKAMMRATPNLIVLGDLNTMGMFYPSAAVSNVRVPANEEIGTIGAQASRRDMAMPPKSHDVTWSDGMRESNLDHVLASDVIQLAQQGTDAQGKRAFVRVKGWVDLAGAQRADFINNISDHSSLFAAVA